MLTSVWCAGTVTGVKSKSPELLWIKFPGDPSRYFFEGKDVRSWLVKEEKPKVKEEKFKAAAKGDSQKAATAKGDADKPESSKAAAAGKKRPAEEKPSSPQKGSPQKKEKVAAGACQPKEHGPWPRFNWI
jgi:hypothetical protein